MGIKDRFGNAKTVREIMQFLEGCDPDAVVVFACDYGDRAHTQQALPVELSEEVSSSFFRESAYSNSGVEYSNDDDGDDEFVDEENDPEMADFRVVVLS